MNARNEFETATNALASGNWELQDELDDADLMAISGGLLDNVNVLTGENALKEGILKGGILNGENALKNVLQGGINL